MKRLFSSLRFHILLPVLFMTLLLILMLTSLISKAYIDMCLRQESDKNAISIDVIAREINKTVVGAITDARDIMIDDRIAAYVRFQYESDSELVRARKECREYLRTELNRRSTIYGLLFMRPDGSLFGAMPYANPFWDERSRVPLPDNVIDRILSVPFGQSTWIGPLSGREVYGFESVNTPKSVMMAAWKSGSVKSGEFYALMLMDDAVFEKMFILLQDGKSAIHLYTADGTEFFSLGSESNLDTGMLLEENNNGRIVKNSRNESYSVFSVLLEESGWTLVREVCMEDYLQYMRKLQFTVWLLVGIAFLVAFGFYCLWFKGFMRRFNALKNDIIRLGQGNLGNVSDTRISIEEFESLRLELIRADLSLKRHMETIRRMEREKLEMEINDLQSVITPHMIFNSITAIRWMATFMGVEEISDMLIELGEMLRPVLREWRVQWTIREELEHISHFARLMDLRYANNFKLECHVPEALREALLPQFTLQPLIENACQHGGHPNGALIVTVEVTDEDEWILLTVADNGRTIPPEKIEEIRERLRSGKRDHGIGLSNVYNRLVICKGEESTLDIQALPEGGTMVTLRWKKDGVLLTDPTT